MKLRRAAVAATATALVIGGVAPVAEAATYPEPLNQVINQMREVGGPQAPNLLLVPAALSSINTIWSLVVIVLALVGAGVGAGIAAVA